ncbi:MAG: UPF0246 protein [Saprospiraceae bacterium]|nr:MAG: UPF0246 protein [Saprospiraceae bacterium]
MIVLLSPAKTLDETVPDYKGFTSPRFLPESGKLVNVLKKKSARSLKKLMGVSDAIATLNVDRFQNFQTPFTLDNAKQALFAFKGDVYLGLQAETFTEAEIIFAQKHLRILSGLYGLLRPLDLIQPYRLEMGTSLKQGRRKNLYEFWNTKITDLINDDLMESGDKLIVNLASKEYFHSVKPSGLNGDLVHVHFKELRKGEYKVISFNAKKARGAMAHQLITRRITDVDTMKTLEVDGYRFNQTLSEDKELFFTK